MDVAPINIVDSKKFWFLHLSANDNVSKNEFLNSLLWLIKFVIWEAKLAKKIPAPRTLMIDFLHLANIVYSCNVILSQSRDLLNVYICRNWERLRHG